jgi:hypothetical protein
MKDQNLSEVFLEIIRIAFWEKKKVLNLKKIG